jgi:hypothetical protein
MKLFIAFDNNGPLNKLAPALQARGLNLIKAAPSDFPIVGLNSAPQLGYSSYIDNLPAFLFATANNKEISLHREGYFLAIPNDKLLPLSFPRIFFAQNKQTAACSALVEQYNGEVYKGKNEEITGTVPFQTGIIPRLLRLENRNVRAFPPIGTVSVDSYPELIQILRIFSQLFRTHTYPAYQEETTDIPEVFEERIAGVKRTLSVAELDNVVGDNWKSVRIDVEGTREWITVKPDSPEIKLHKAKPVSVDVLPWGGPSNIPRTSGILFPFLRELSKPDKQMVPFVIERSFLKSLANTMEGINDRHHTLVKAWCKDIYSSDIGHILSHLALGIKVACTSQSRVFPIIESNQYLGFYLSGARFACGLKGVLHRPVSFDENMEDIASLGTHESVLGDIAALLVSDKKKMRDWILPITSMVRLHQQLDQFILSSDKLERIRELLPGLHFPQAPLRPTLENIHKVLSAIVNKEMPNKDEYIHYLAVGIKDVYTQQLSRFGTLIPSPDIPGAPRMSVVKKPSSMPNGPLAFRQTTLSSAIADWKEVVSTKAVHNGPVRLNARYQHVAFSSVKDKEGWFDIVMGFVKGMDDRFSGLVPQVDILDDLMGNLSKGSAYDDM